MDTKAFPVIDLVETGKNIRHLRVSRGLSVRDLQNYFGFAEPRAIYKWQKGESLPTVDNLYALSSLFEVSMDQILVPTAAQLHMINEQQEMSCCSDFLLPLFFSPFGIRQVLRDLLLPFLRSCGCRSGEKTPYAGVRIPSVYLFAQKY